MRKLLFIISIFSLPFVLISQNINVPGITFNVSDVKKPKSDLPETTYKRAIERRIDRLIEGYPIENDSIRIVSTGFNAFVSTVHFAYAQHRPLIISPDMIWLLISQGFSIHVNKNSKALQSKIVTHNGKKEILITRHDFRKGENNPWTEVFETFTDSIRTYFQSNLYDLVVADFSTTGISERAAYQITLMESTKKYFEPAVETGCGIPQITLEGTVDDWKWIRNNVDKFREYDLDNWVDNLIPVLDEFVNASQNSINKEFWEDIYKVSEHYYPVYSTGWLLKFFPYYQKWKTVWKESGGYRYTEYLPNPYIEGENHRLSTIMTKDFPNGVSKVPFTWKYEVGDVKEEYEMEIYAGFIGFKQNKETKSVRPEISWAIRDAKSSWLGTKNSPYPKKTRPFDYYYTRIEKNPTIKPIFAPNECDTYSKGIEKLNQHIRDKVKEIKKNKQLSGKVLMKFVVTWEGTIAKIKIIKGTGSIEDGVAKQIISELPKWKAGIKKDKWLGEVPNLYRINYLQSVEINFDIE